MHAIMILKSCFPAVLRSKLVLICCLFPVISFAQQSDSLQLKFKKPGYYVSRSVAPACLIISGVLANGKGEESFKNEFKEERDEYFSHFHTHADDYLQYAPIGLAYGFDALGMQSKTDLANRTVILLKSELLIGGVVTTLKHTIPDLRPDGSAHNSFPSGHTAQAFAAATFFTEEYGKQYKWTPYLAYGIASSVGLMRVANNRHYISDVLAGAGIGIISTEVAYFTHRYKWGKRHAKLPVPVI
jgi:hypothetical protein